ncbi:VWA domain-containing protein [Umezawaea sp.]|uniref:VWA domain-containing protein n=1 Tax=Umezawaea sp. TaxID=1955258 RepID=UPI002ED42288
MQDQQATLPALQVVVLVDQSGSLDDADVTAEKEAARTIAASVLAPGSVVSVVGFGSSERPGQSAVDVVCQPTKLDSAQQRDQLAKCIGDLRKRNDGEGDGTDHATALQQALAFVGGAVPEKKVVFLLTDGKLDVSESPAWGDTPERRNGAAAAKVREVLGELDGVGAQVWPLGFGDVDTNALSGFAKGVSCTPAAPNPRERVVPGAAELRTAVVEALSSASCVKINPLVNEVLPPGGSVELVVDIPAIASDASILVFKRDARVQVEYRAPGASEPAPRAGGSDFEFAGQSTETESLRVTDPEPGRWTVRLSSSDIPAQEVAATVVYQAAVKANLTATPPRPAAGEEVEVDMQVWARGRAVVDPEMLKGLTFTTAMTGGSGFPEQKVTLADGDGDGTFSGRFTVPDDASGDLTFTGEVTGIGVGGDTRVLSTKVLEDAAQVQAQILFDSNRATVVPGGTVSGTVSITNNSGKPARLKLVIDSPSAGTTLTVDPATVEAAPGKTEVQYALRFGADTAIGPSGAALRLVDDANTPVAERLLAVEVAPEPGLLEKYLWLWIPLGVLLLAGALWALLGLRSRSEAGKARGLLAQLWQGGFPASELTPRDANAKVFRFVVQNDFTGPQLQHAGDGDPTVYEVRRVSGGVSLTAPGEQPVVLAIGERHDIGDDTAVAFVDEFGAVGVTAGPPATPFATPDPFATGSAPAGDPFAASFPSGSSYSSADPFDVGTSGGTRHAGPAPDAGTAVDPNNPFA